MLDSKQGQEYNNFQGSASASERRVELLPDGTFASIIVPIPGVKTLFRVEPGCPSPSSGARLGRSALGVLQDSDMMVHCAGCERPILDRFLLNVLDRAWHAKCVQCCECNCNLTEKCFSRDGKLYCKIDFFR